jgi:DNA-binding transcriptional ArsR family regulator
MDKTLIWLIRGSQRKAFLSNLPESPFLSNKLRKELNEKHEMNLSLREVSRHLRDFEKKFLVRCLNQKDPYNRIYELTTKGKKIRKDISKSGL